MNMNDDDDQDIHPWNGHNDRSGEIIANGCLGLVAIAAVFIVFFGGVVPLLYWLKAVH